MAIMPGAAYRPLNQFSNQGARPRLGVVLHVNDSQGNQVTSTSGDSLYGWISSNPSRPGNQMSCHFQVSQSGLIEQYIDTDNGSWCQAAGNDDYISVETEGVPGREPVGLTAEQVRSCARIMAWVHAVHGVPLQLADAPGRAGLGWHGMGGRAWGGHSSCPGVVRVAQRAQILTLAGAAAGQAQPLGGGVPLSTAQSQPPKEIVMAESFRTCSGPDKVKYAFTYSGAWWSVGDYDAYVTTLPGYDGHSYLNAGQFNALKMIVASTRRPL